MVIASHDVRRKVESELTELAASGDLIFRYGEAKHFEPLLLKGANISIGVSLRFSKMVTEVTHSDSADLYSHVAVLQRMSSEDVRVWDMSDEGLRRFELRDWMRESHKRGVIEVRRLRHNHEKVGQAAVLWLEKLRDEDDPEYDFKFQPQDGQYYCAEAANAAYQAQGIEMPDPVQLADQPGWGVTHKLISWKAGIKTRVILPGNSELGMRSSKTFKVVYSYEGEQA